MSEKTAEPAAAASACWDFACRDWEARIRTGRSLVPDLPLIETQARRAVEIFNKLHLPDVKGKPPLAEAAGDWFRDIVGALFGSLKPDTGERMVRELFALVPKKNSKTTGAAGIMLTALLVNERPRAEFLLIGPTKSVAELAFRQAVGMIESDPEGYLGDRMHVQDHLKTITDRRTKAQLKIKSFDSSVLTGVKPVGTLIDELHEIAHQAGAANIIGQLRGGMIANPEGFLAFITTQSDKPPAGAFRQELLKARMIRDGTLAGVPMLPVLYEFPRSMLVGGEAAPWRDTSTWHMVTPNLGRSITLPRLIQDFDAAKISGEAEINRWASQHLNIEIGLGLQADAWAGAGVWEAAAEPALTLDDILERCEVAVAGIDGGGLDDLFGLTILGRERGTRRWLSWSHAWVLRSVLELRKAISPVLLDFEADGDLTLIDRVGDDVDQCVAIIARVDEAGILAEENAVGLDPFGVGAVVDALAEVEIGEGRVVAVSQGYKLQGAIKTSERKLAAGDLRHGGRRLMAWCVGNAKVEIKGNAVTITKQAAGTAKIDPLMSLFDAVALMSGNPPVPNVRSAYEERGLLVV